MNLAGKTILMTRAPDQSGEMAAMIKSCGGVPLSFPTIEILPPPDWVQVDSAVSRLHMYDGVIFTSGNAVNSLFSRMDELGAKSSLFRGKTVFAVGARTAELLRERGIGPVSVPEKQTSLELSRLLSSDDLGGRSYLFPKGNLAGGIIPSALKNLGAQVDEVIVYRTERPADSDLERVLSLLRGRMIDVITFTSPSAVKNFFNLLGATPMERAGGKPLIAVIGPTTAESLRGFNMEADIMPERYTVDELIKSIDKYFGDKKI